MSERQIIAGRYEKIREIGVGGMGTVSLGSDTITGERLAIKELKPEVIKADPEIVERFAREGEVLRKLNHPSIVKVLATAEEAGRHFIMMEYVDGGSLLDKLVETPQLPIDEVLNIGLDLSDALARAHRLNIIHRDIKPANVLIAEDGTPRLTDFGVARIGDTTRLTKTGVVVGTLAYLSPEAVSSQAIDERSDLWAFGVMLYEMVAGVRPFDAESPGALLMKILKDPVPDILKYRPYDQLGSWGLPGLIYWLLEKEPDKRPQSARLVGAVLENLLSGKELPMNWFGDTSGLYDDNPVSLPPDTAVQAIKDYTSSSMKLEDLVRLNDELARVDADLATTPPKLERQGDTTQPEKTVPPSALSHDIDQPIPQPDSDFKGKSRPIPTRAALVIGAIVLLVAIVGLLTFIMRPAPIAPTPTSNIVIEPVAAGEYMVLVAEPEHIEGETRDVQRFITDDLRFNLEAIPLSKIRIRAYPGVIRSAAEAQRIAEQYHAHLILWGNYDSDRVEINIQIGDWELYPKLVFPHEQVEAVVNARYQMTNERQETLAFGIISALNAIIPMSNGAWDMTLNLAIAERIDEPTAIVQGNNVNAYFHRYFTHYLDDTAASVDYINEAIDLEPNGLLYSARALAYARLGNIEASRQDVRTARQIGPANWINPDLMDSNDLIYFQNNFEDTLPYLDTILEQVQDDWFYWAYRGTVHYMVGDDEAVAVDMEQALALDPQANFAYLPAIGLALREADFVTAQALFNEVLRKFPDPRFIERILLVTYNEASANTVLPKYVSAFGNFTLRRWQGVISDTESIIELGNVFRSDVYFLRGFAYCNLGDDAAAEAAYSAGIAMEPDFTVLYFLRAEVRRNQGNLLGAAQDIATVTTSPQASAFQSLISAATTGGVSCRNFLDMDLTQLFAEATQEAQE